jgi:hypothetical protein
MHDAFDERDIVVEPPHRCAGGVSSRSPSLLANSVATEALRLRVCERLEKVSTGFHPSRRIRGSRA